MLQHSRRQRTCYLDLSMRNLWLSSWAQKIDQKSSLVLWKIKYHPRREKEVSPFEKAPYLEPEEIRTEERFQLLIKSYNNNTLQEDNYPVSEIQEKCQIPLEKPSIRVLLPLARAFSSYSGLYKVIKSPSLSFEKAQCKNNKLPRQHAPNDIFIRGLLNGKRFADIYTSTLRVSDQYQKVLPRANIDFRISRGDSRFWKNDFEPSQGETPQSTEYFRN